MASVLAVIGGFVVMYLIALGVGKHIQGEKADGTPKENKEVQQ